MRLCAKHCSWLLGIAFLGLGCTKFGLKQVSRSNAALLESATSLSDGASASVLLPADLKKLAGSLVIEEGSNLANPAFSSSLELGTDLSAAGPSVNIRSKTELSSVDIGRLQIEIPLSSASNLRLTETLVVLYAVTGADGKVQIGAIPAGEGKGYVLNETKLRFGLRGFGNYQAVYLSLPLTEEKMVQDDSMSTQSKSQVEAKPSMRIAKISPTVVSAGETITIKGMNLREGMNLTLNSQKLDQVQLVDSETVTAIVPSSSKRGEAKLFLYQQGVEFETPMLYAGGIDDFPISTVPASEQCIGIKFYDRDGNLQEGTRACGVSLPVCTVAGQTGCQTTASFPSMDKTSVTTATNLTESNFPGVIAASGSFQFWGVDGQRYQLSGDPHLIPSNLANGISIFGVTGNASLETHSLCTSDGATGCVIGPNYAATVTSGLASKVILGQTVAGVAGVAAAETHSPCTAAHESGCVTGNEFSSMDIRAASPTITDLSSGTFGSTIASAGLFEFWDSQGNRHQLSGDTDLMPAHIAAGVVVYGMNGTATLESHANCGMDGEMGCVVLGPTYAAAVKTGLSAKVVSGQTVAGVNGAAVVETHSACTGANQSACVATASFKTMDLTAMGSAGTLTSFNFFAALGTATPVEFWDAAGVRHQVSGDADLLPAKLVAGTDLFGVVGTATLESHSDCASDGSTGCVATSQYTAAATAGLSVKVKSGQSVAGVVGSLIEETHSSCSAANQSGCVATNVYKTMDLSNASVMTDLTASNFAGSLSSAGAFEFWDSMGNRHQASGDADLIPANLAQGILIHGVTGTLVAETHSNCSFDGQVGCAVIGPAMAAAVTTGLSAKLLTGQAAAGVSGSAIGESHSNCTAANQAGCVATSTYKTMNLSAAGGASGLTAANFNSLLSTSANFEFWDASGARQLGTGSASLISGNIKSGVSLWGVTGAYPSASFPLPSASATADLDAATFDAKLKSASPFEYWKSDGTYQTGAGDTDLSAVNIKEGVTIFSTTGTLTAEGMSCPYATQASCEANLACLWSGGACHLDPWNIRVGMTVAGVAGALKTNCRNRANSSIFNADTMPPGDMDTNSGVTIDWWDTTDDYNLDGAFPTSLVAGWSSATDCDQTVWKDLTADGICDSAGDDCLMKDRISGLIWSESYPVSGADAQTYSLTWSEAVDHCNALVFGGFGDWRLPTQKEMQDGYVHGIRSVGYTQSGTVRGAGSLDNNSAFIANVDDYFWSSTTVSYSPTSAWRINLPIGEFYANPKTGSEHVLCVRP